MINERAISKNIFDNKRPSSTVNYMKQISVLALSGFVKLIMDCLQNQN